MPGKKDLLMTSGGYVGKTKNSPYVHHSCKYVDGILSPTACYSLDFPPLWCNKFKVLPHWATIEHIYILFGALQSFRKGSQSARSSFVSVALVCTHPAPPEWFHAACLANSLSHLFLRRDSFIYMPWTAGRPAHWRHSKALRLVWEFPSSIFESHSKFPDVARNDGGK